jgi:hypothetical protein
MALFDFLRKKSNEEKIEISPENILTPSENLGEGSESVEKENDKHKNVHEIPEHIFVEYEKPNQKTPMEPTEIPQEVNDIHSLYRYLEQNLEKKGYEDALMNPDTSYMEENVRFLQNELNITISKVNTYYKNHVRQINFHIETRKRHEMIEMVDELLTKKANVEDEMGIVSSIENDAKSGNGITQNVVLSYKKGFRNGFAAITYGTILSKKS